ncbi:MAG: EAL domain-containing protein [Methylococcaceae bacterium]|jgi:diguanylate cyclase (GGDEF)-like protein/PAS domain S-box-containing protein
MKLLYVEDSTSDVELTKQALARLAPDINMDVADTIDAAILKLKVSANYDVVLIDLHLPDGLGFDILSYIRENTLPLAVIILTGSGDQESAIAAIKSGADDYLVKRCAYLDILPSTLRSALARYRDLSGLRNQMLRVLFIENTLSDQAIISQYLCQHAPHIKLSMVCTAEEAISKLLNTGADLPRFDLLLVNYHLPGMDGLEFSKIVHQELKLDIPVVLLTSQDNEELAVNALQLGVEDYLTKRTGYLYELAVTLDKVKRQADLRHERASLREINQRLNHLIATSPSLLFCLSVKGETLSPAWVSENIKGLLGYSQAEALTFDNWWQQTHPDDLIQTQAAARRIINEGNLTHDYRIQHRDGHTIWVREALRLVKDEQGHAIEVIGTWLDQSDIKRRESVQMARNAVLDQIVGHSKLHAILEDIALRLEQINPDMRVSILLLDRRKGRLFNGAAPSLPAYYNDAVDGLMPGLGHGSCGTAVWLGEPVIVTDIDSHPYWQTYLELTKKANLHACWSLPFKDEKGHVLGSFGIYYATKRAPSVADLELIEEFARITALAVQKVQATDELRLLAEVFKSIRDGVMITDLEPNIIAINHAFTEITGYSEEEVLDCNPSLLQSGRHDANFFKLQWLAIEQTGHWQGEVWNRRKNGEIYPQWLTISTVVGELGNVKNYVGVFTDISQVKQSEARLEYLAHYDPLTRLPNRLLIQARIEQAIERAKRHDYRIAVLYIDLDRFKTVNDSLGHPVGDELLIALSARLSTRLRQDDILARLGGDEFLLVMEFVPQPEDTATLALSLIELLSTPFKLPSGHEVFIGISIGISLYPDDCSSVTELIQYADLAMYQAKQMGRNTYQFHTEALSYAASERLALETNLRYALERNQFVLLYQPLINAQTGTLIGVEALLRWQISEHHLELPSKFIPIAEDTGLIVPIGEWVLRTACTQACTWTKAGLPPLIMAVNLSGRQFQSGKIVSLVDSILKETGLPARQLELELTESIVMDQAEQSINTLNELKALGVRLSIDDFGTGYSSLAYLSRFPIDKLKIDRSFVRDVTENNNNSKIASAIIAMARSLKLDVLAEGLETKQQLALLCEYGCDQYQGYLFSKPLTAIAIEDLLVSYQHNSNNLPNNLIKLFH